MNGYSEHVSFDVLNDLVDGTLTREHREVVERHIEACESCRAEHDLLRHTLELAESVPSRVLPTPDLWPDLRAELERRKSASIIGAGNAPGQTGVANSDRAWVLRSRMRLAAAAIVLVALSSTVTAVVLRNESGARNVARDSANTAPGDHSTTSVAIPASFRSTETEYLRTIEDLRRALDARRSQLQPQTVATVERSLAVIDSAIAEARAALLADPDNTELLDLLSASYQHKLDLLRRASELGFRT